MHVVDLSRDQWGEARTFHPIDEAGPQEAPGRIEHPGCPAQALPIAAEVSPRTLDDLHTVRRDDIRHKWRRRRSTFRKRHGCNLELTREHPVEQFTRALAQYLHPDLGVLARQSPN